MGWEFEIQFQENYPGSGYRGHKSQCCGTGTVGTVTFCLVEPEPEP